MLYHHDNRDYNVAASEAATRARGILEGIINKGAANAGRVLEKVMTEVPTDHIVKGDQITFHAVPLNPDDPRSRFAVQAEFEDKPRFSLHNHAFAQVRERLHIPAAEISEFLAQPDYRLTPTDILSYARKPTAWAIAQIILGARRGEWTGG
jgi:hypothetical protein